ncbi:MAG: DUF4097 domain-containing protein [Spirochaetales bacterium]|nr:DUF4097 domain-containing protein [Spirochaetales bacterium]
MHRKLLPFLFIGLTASLSAQTLSQRQTMSLRRVENIILYADFPTNILGLHDENRTITISGQESEHQIVASLSGNMHLQNTDVLPQIRMERRGENLEIRLYPVNEMPPRSHPQDQLNLSLSLPRLFPGSLKIITANLRVNMNNLHANAMDVQSASGDLSVQKLSGGSLNLTTASGDITVQQARMSGPVLVQAASGDLYLNELQCSQLQGLAESGDAEFLNIQSSEHITLQLSSGDLFIQNMHSEQTQLKILSGDTTLEEFVANTTQLETISGDIQIGHLQSSSLMVNQKSGDFVAQTLKTQDADIRTTGETQVHSAQGQFYLTGNSRPADITFTSLTSTVDISIKNANATVYIPATSSFELFLESKRGEVECDFPINGTVQENQWNGEVGEGGPTVWISSRNGNVTLRKAL